MMWCGAAPLSIKPRQFRLVSRPLKEKTADVDDQRTDDLLGLVVLIDRSLVKEVAGPAILPAAEWAKRSL
jgi:hypothetical protein